MQISLGNPYGVAYVLQKYQRFFSKYLFKFYFFFISTIIVLINNQTIYFLSEKRNLDKSLATSLIQDEVSLKRVQQSLKLRMNNVSAPYRTDA